MIFSNGTKYTLSASLKYKDGNDKELGKFETKQDLNQYIIDNPLSQEELDNISHVEVAYFKNDKKGASYFSDIEYKPFMPDYPDYYYSDITNEEVKSAYFDNYDCMELDLHQDDVSGQSLHLMLGIDKDTIPADIPECGELGCKLIIDGYDWKLEKEFGLINCDFMTIGSNIVKMLEGQKLDESDIELEEVDNDIKIVFNPQDENALIAIQVGLYTPNCKDQSDNPIIPCVHVNFNREDLVPLLAFIHSVDKITIF